MDATNDDVHIKDELDNEIKENQNKTNEFKDINNQLFIINKINGNKTANNISFTEWVRKMERSILGKAYETNLFPEKINEAGIQIHAQIEDEKGKNVDPNDEDYLKRKKARFVVNASKSYQRIKIFFHEFDEKIYNSTENDPSLTVEEWTEYVILHPNSNIQQKDSIDEIRKIIISPILFKNKYKKIYGTKLFYRILKEKKQNVLENNNNNKKTESEYQYNDKNNNSISNEMKSKLQKVCHDLVNQFLMHHYDLNVNGNGCTFYKNKREETIDDMKDPNYFYKISLTKKEKEFINKYSAESFLL